MSSCVLEDTQKSPLVLMGQTQLIETGDCARAVLGSCIGLAIIDVQRELCALAHIVLPKACDRTGMPGKFADTAIPHMLELLLERKASRPRLIAKFAGGAHMFGNRGPLNIGDENVQAVTSLLESLDIPIAGRNVGGQQGRRVCCDAIGQLTIEILGAPPVVL